MFWRLVSTGIPFIGNFWGTQTLGQFTWTMKHRLSYFWTKKSGRWHNMFFVIVCTPTCHIFNDFAPASTNQNYIFRCHTVRNGTDLRKSPPQMRLLYTYTCENPLICSHRTKHKTFKMSCNRFSCTCVLCSISAPIWQEWQHWECYGGQLDANPPGQQQPVYVGQVPNWLLCCTTPPSL